MAIQRDEDLKTDIENAVINSFIQTDKIKWTAIRTPQLRRFAANLRDAIVKHSNTPAFRKDFIISPTPTNPTGIREFTIRHDLGYIPQVNPLEKFVQVGGGAFGTPPTFEFRVIDVGGTNGDDPRVVKITTTEIIVEATVADRIRVTLW